MAKGGSGAGLMACRWAGLAHASPADAEKKITIQACDIAILQLIKQVTTFSLLGKLNK
jgi:hypothetical protein